MLSKKKKIEPELLTTPWSGQAVSTITRAMQTPYEPYPAGEVDVGRIMESPYYQSIKKGALTEEQEALNRLRRGASLGGMLYSSPRLGAEAELIGQTTTKLGQILGGLAEQERQQNIARSYQEWLRKAQYPVQQSQLAQLLLGYQPWYYPMYTEQPTGFGQFMDFASPLLSALILAA